MDAREFSRRIVVRHREAGYLRLELPGEICHAAAAATIERGLRAVAGVYRVTVYPADRRLAVRYDANACGAADVAHGLKALLGELPEPAADGASTAPAPSVLSLPPLRDIRVQARRVFADLRTRLERLRQPGAPPGSLQAKLQPMLANALTEKAVTNFLNDIVAFYLIKVHWELITQRWLKDPVKYGNAWLTTFYLVFLLVRYRKSVAKPAALPAPPAEPRP